HEVGEETEWVVDRDRLEVISHGRLLEFYRQECQIGAVRCEAPVDDPAVAVRAVPDAQVRKNAGDGADDRPQVPLGRQHDVDPGAEDAARRQVRASRLVEFASVEVDDAGNVQLGGLEVDDVVGVTAGEEEVASVRDGQSYARVRESAPVGRFEEGRG